jgi:hypothetical protein
MGLIPLEYLECLGKMKQYWIPGINTLEDFSLYLSFYFDKKISSFLSSDNKLKIMRELFGTIDKSYSHMYNIFFISKNKRCEYKFHNLSRFEAGINMMKFSMEKNIFNNSNYHIFYTIGSKYYSVNTPLNYNEVGLEIKKVEPEIKKIEPEIKKVEPEIKKIEPEIKKIEPEIKKIEPEIKKVEPKLESKKYYSIHRFDPLQLTYPKQYYDDYSFKNYIIDSETWRYHNDKG